MWSVPDEFTVKIGGNLFSNVTTIIRDPGGDIFTLKRREEDGLLGIDFIVYDSQGRRLAVVRNGHIVDGNRELLEFHKTDHHYSATERKTGRVVCDVKQSRKAVGCEIELFVDMFSKSGTHLLATPDMLQIGGTTLKGTVLSDGGAAITIQ